MKANVQAEITKASKDIESATQALIIAANDYEKKRKDLQQKLTLASSRLSALTSILKST